MPKRRLPPFAPTPDLSSLASATECTGLVPALNPEDGPDDADDLTRPQDPVGPNGPAE